MRRKAAMTDQGLQIKSSEKERVIHRLYELTENQRVNWETLGESEFRFTRGNWIVFVGHKVFDGNPTYYFRIRNTAENFLMESNDPRLKKLVHSLEGVSPIELFLEEVI
jgi:hypothetical protein